MLGGQGPQRSSVLFLPMGQLPPLQVVSLVPRGCGRHLLLRAAEGKLGVALESLQANETSSMLVST